MRHSVPYEELIAANGTLVLRSVFDFVDGGATLFAFLHGCRERNCVVVFENEVYPQSDFVVDLLLTHYAALAVEDSKLAKDYLRYMAALNGGDRVPTVVRRGSVSLAKGVD